MEWVGVGLWGTAAGSSSLPPPLSTCPRLRRLPFDQMTDRVPPVRETAIERTAAGGGRTELIYRDLVIHEVKKFLWALF